MLTGWERKLWQPASEAAAVNGATVELTFDRLTNLSAVVFYATGQLKGQVSILLRKQGDWIESAASGKQNIQKVGWQYYSIPDGEDAQAVRLVFEDVAGKGKISEVRAIGSNLSAGDEPVVNITYPDAG